MKETTGLAQLADQGPQNVGIVYNKHLPEYGIIASIGLVGESCDNTLAENVNGSHNNELINIRTWNDVVDVESANFEWVTCWDESRRCQSLDYCTSVEVKTKF